MSLLGRVFAIDVRSLAVLRVGLGLAVLADLLSRLPNAATFYTDAGLFPRGAMPDAYSLAPISVHELGGSLASVHALFAVAACAAVALILGWRTRTATLLCWLLVRSVQWRHPMVRDGGDQVLSLLLLWSLLLPLGAACALDARGASKRPAEGRVLSFAGAGLCLQLVFLYVFSVFHKLRSPDWLDLSATAWALGNERRVRPLGEWLAGFPTGLELLTAGVLVAELVAPLLLLSPWKTGRLRALAIAALVALQAGLGSSLYLGLFPWTSTLALVPFVPGSFWERCGWRWEPGTAATAPAWLRRGREALAAAMLLFVTLYNLDLSNDRIPDSWKILGRRVGLNQNWIMYSRPPKSNVRWLVGGRTEKGRTLLIDDEGARASWSPLQELRDTYRGRTFLELTTWLGEPRHRTAFLQWVCRRWNAECRPVDRVAEVELYFLRTPIVFDGSEPPQQSDLMVRESCSGSP